MKRLNCFGFNNLLHHGINVAQSRGAFLFLEQNLVANLIEKGGDYNCKYTRFPVFLV